MKDIFDTNLRFIMTPERRFSEFINKSIRIINPNELSTASYWGWNDIIVFEHHPNFNRFWLNNGLVWLPIMNEFKLTYDEMEAFLTEMVLKYFNIKVEYILVRL